MTIIIILIIWFGDTVTMSHLTKCNTNSKVQVMLTNYPHPFLQGAFHLTKPRPHVWKRKHGSSSLTVMPWTTTDEYNLIPRNMMMIGLAYGSQLANASMIGTPLLLFYLLLCTTAGGIPNRYGRDLALSKHIYFWLFL